MRDIKNWWTTPHDILLAEITERTGPVKWERFGGDLWKVSLEDHTFLLIGFDQGAPISWSEVLAYGKTKATAIRELYRSIFVSLDCRMIRSTERPPACVIEEQQKRGLSTEAA